MKRRKTRRAVKAPPSAPPWASRNDSSPSCRRVGFTLIEMLVAVTILAIMTIAIARITSQTNEAIASNTREAVQNANARAALDMLARDFAEALCDARLKFKWDQGAATTYGTLQCDDIAFCSYRNIPSADDNSPPNHEAMCISYGVQLDLGGAPSVVYALLRKEKPIAIADYSADRSVTPSPPADGNDGQELIRNVVEFRIDCRTASGAAVTEGSDQTNLPAYVDICLSLLTDRDIQRLNALSGTTQTTYIHRNAKRYFTRVFSYNRNAYINGR